MLNKLYKNHIKEIDKEFKLLQDITPKKCLYCDSENTIIVSEYRENCGVKHYSICKKHFLIESYKYYNDRWNSYYKNQK